MTQPTSTAAELATLGTALQTLALHVEGEPDAEAAVIRAQAALDAIRKRVELCGQLMTGTVLAAPSLATSTSTEGSTPIHARTQSATPSSSGTPQRRLQVVTRPTSSGTPEPVEQLSLHGPPPKPRAEEIDPDQSRAARIALRERLPWLAKVPLPEAVEAIR